MAKSYSEKLRDPRWQKKRLEVMQRAKFRCESCDSDDKTLHVHHRIYRKGAEPWEYDANELRCLCEDCHENEHQWRALLGDVLAKVDASDIEYILGYAEGRLAITWDQEQRDDTPIKVKSWEHADGLLAALWRWNTPNERPDPGCLIDHKSVDDRLVCALGEGEMPFPKQGGG